MVAASHVGLPSGRAPVHFPVRLREQERTDPHASLVAERRRIASEVHDALGHYLTVIGLLAAAGLQSTHPGSEAADLARIHATAQEGLAALREFLGTHAARPVDDRAAMSTIARLPLLIERIAAAGLTVSLRIEGSPVEVDEETDHVAFRLVQEALTNAMRHAVRSTITTTITWCEDALVLRVSSEGNGSGPRPTSRGRGLAGMIARVASIGGCVVVGFDEANAYVVAARIPLRPITAEELAS
jgi:signal transduction histidine kinase